MRAALISRSPHLRLRLRGSLGRYKATRTTALQIRHFHPSKPTRLIAESVLVAHSLLQGVHTITHLPWVASIPLTAIIVRSIVAIPLQIVSMFHGRAQQTLSPLVIAWGRYHQLQVMSKAQAAGLALGPTLATRKVDRAWKRSRRGLYWRMGVRPWFTYLPFLQLPVWLSVMESIRWMVDGPGGLLRWLQSWTGPVDTASATPFIPVAESMSTEGALWFPNLLAADPTWTLPIMLSATLLTNITLGWKVPTKEATAELPRPLALRSVAFSGLKSILQMLAVGIGPLAIVNEIPAGLLIYWISSTLFATAQTQIMAKVIRTTPPPTPIKPKDVGVVKLPVSGKIKTNLSK